MKQAKQARKANKGQKGKLIALGELGSLPSPEQLRSMDKFAWFMIWSGFTSEYYNTPDELKAVFTMPEVINLGDEMPE